MRNSVYKIIQTAFLGALALSLIAAPGRATPNSAEAVQWLQKGIRAYEREDFGAAKTSLNMALQLQPDFSEAYLLKALLEQHDGQLEKADASLKRALELNPRLPDQMRKKLEARAHGIESNLTQQDFSHFRLQFNGAEHREEAWQAVKSLDEAYNDLGTRFTYFPEALFPVVIFTSGEFWEAWNAPGWLGGFFDNRDGRIRVRIDPPPGGDEEFRRRLRHEFTHAFINRLYTKDLPVWFQEGIAQFYAYASPSNEFWKDVRLEELRKLLKGAPELDLDRLEHVIRKKDAPPGLIYLAYLESEALVLFIAKERGDSWIPSMIERLRAGAAFENAFEDVAGTSPAEKLKQVQHALS